MAPERAYLGCTPFGGDTGISTSAGPPAPPLEHMVAELIGAEASRIAEEWVGAASKVIAFNPEEMLGSTDSKEVAAFLGLPHNPFRKFTARRDGIPSHLLALTIGADLSTANRTVCRRRARGAVLPFRGPASGPYGMFSRPSQDANVVLFVPGALFR